MRRVLVCFASAVISACGVPVEADFEPIQVDVDPPAGLEEQADEELESVSIYLVRNEQLVHATRDLSTPIRAEEVLASLFQGVTDPEHRSGLLTMIPPGSKILEVAQEGPLLRLDLSRDFAVVGGEEEIRALAQIVLTATSIDGVQSVTFALEGVPTDVPVADGALSVDAVGRGDYVELLGP